MDGGVSSVVASAASSTSSSFLSGENISSNSRNSTILFHCSNPLELDAVKLEKVLESGCDINVQNYRGESALHLLINGEH